MTRLIGIAVIVLFYLFCIGATRLLTPRLYRRQLHFRGFTTATTVIAIIVCI